MTKVGGMLRGIKLLGASGFVWAVGLWLFATSPLAPSCTRRFPSAWAGARGWVVDTAGHGGWFHPAGVRLLAKCRVVCGHLTSTRDECC